MGYAIDVKGLKKSYGNNAVLKGVEFNVAKGETFALLGVNGTGKTTTLECIEGLLKYDSGSITVTGKMGIQLQSASLPDHIRAMEAVGLFAKWNKTEIDYPMLTAFGINKLAKEQYSRLSMGQKRRLHLALSLICKPDIIFLDEPTAGLDVEGRLSLHDEIRKLKEQGKTIIMASHDMAEVESLCDRIAILRNGQIAFVGSAEELTASIGHHCIIHIKTNSKNESFETADINNTLLNRIKEYNSKGDKIVDIKIDRGTLEQHFINISRGNGK